MAEANCPLRLCDQGVTCRGPHPSLNTGTVPVPGSTVLYRVSVLSTFHLPVQYAYTPVPCRYRWQESRLNRSDSILCAVSPVTGRYRYRWGIQKFSIPTRFYSAHKLISSRVREAPWQTRHKCKCKNADRGPNHTGKAPTTRRMMILRCCGILLSSQARACSRPSTACALENR